MEILQAKTADLIPYGFNNRDHSQQQIDRIANSINEFGFNQPIVVDEQNIVLVGHGRLEAAKKLGLEDVPVLKKIGLSETQKKAYRILDNKLQNDSTWNTESLEIELAALEEADFDFGAFGLDELSKLFPNEKEGHDDDFNPTKAFETIIKPGDLIELGEHRLVCGDSTDSSHVDLAMQGDNAQLVVTDPPYGVSYSEKNAFLNEIDGGNRVETPIANDNLGREQTQELWKKVFVETHRVMSRGAVIYCFMPQGGDQMMMMMMMMMNAGIEPRHELIWLKNNHVFGRVDYAYIHEPILYGWKETGHKFYGDFQTSVLEFKRPSKSDLHPTMKPVDLVARLISNSSRAGEIVYEPFCGSGTTLVAADQLGRKCFAMEISPTYCQVIVDRYKAHCERAGKPFVCKLNGEDVSAYISTTDQLADADKLIGS